MIKDKNTKKIKNKGAKSLKINIVCLCDLSVIAVMIVSMLFTIPNYSTNMKEQVKNNMENLSIAYGMLIDNEIDEEGQISSDSADSLINGVKVQGLDSSYAYLVSEDGTMIYHPTESKIGQPVENEIVLSVVDELKKGNIPGNKVVEYDFRGVKKYAGYYISPKNHSILVISADEAEVLKPVKSLIVKIAITEIVLLIFISIIVELVAKSFVKPLKKLMDLVNKTAQYDFSDNNNYNDILLKKNEIGEIGRAFVSMRDNIKTIVYQIRDVSVSITSSTDNLKNVTNIINNNSRDNSKITKELASKMEQTSLAADNINNNIININGKVNEIDCLSQSCLEVVKEIMVRAERITNRTETAKVSTKKICEGIMQKTEKSINQARSVERINNLTNTIMTIANQTSMLALNASIEAARAGEYGKGFAVVADQIANLANESAETVSGITEIIDDVNIAVDDMIDCMNQTLEFLSKDITNDYEGFTQVGKQYKEDACTFSDNSKNISYSVNMLSDKMKNISKLICQMNETINYSTSGIKDISKKTSDTVDSLLNAYDEVKKNVNYSNELNNIVSKFKF